MRIISAVFAVGLLTGCAAQAPVAVTPSSESPPPVPPPSVPPMPVPPLYLNADWLLALPEPPLQPTGDPKVDAYRQTLIDGGESSWRPVFRRLLADMRVDPGQVARYDAMRAIGTPAEYLDHYLTPERIAEGRKLYAELGGKDPSGDGTPLELKLALWGALADYGKRPDMDLLSAMVTLAAYGKLHQVSGFPIHEAAMLIIDRKVDRAKLRGFDSGRLGDIQYTPDFYSRLGRDGDADGKIDVWDNRADILANLWLDRAGGEDSYVVAVKPHRFDPADPGEARILQAMDNQAIIVTYFQRWDSRPWTAEQARGHGRYIEPFGKTGPAYLLSMAATPVASRNPYNKDYDYRIEDGFALAIGLLAEGIAGRPVHAPGR